MSGRGRVARPADEMQIQIHSKQLGVGDALRAQTKSKIALAAGKYFDGNATSTVTFSRESHEIRCDCLIHLSSGVDLQASASAADARIALERATDRLEKRLRRYKRRLKTHHAKSGGRIETVTSAAYAIDNFEDER